MVALEAAGWRVAGIRVDAVDGPALWRVTIESCDESVSITATEADPDEALEALARLAAASEERAL